MFFDTWTLQAASQKAKEDAQQKTTDGDAGSFVQEGSEDDAGAAIRKWVPRAQYGVS